MTINKVRKTIVINENINKKIRVHQADAIMFFNRSISYSEIINLLVGMTLNDDNKMETIDNYFAKIIERKSR